MADGNRRKPGTNPTTAAPADASSYSRNLYGTAAADSARRANAGGRPAAGPAHARAASPAYQAAGQAGGLQSADVYREITRMRRRKRRAKRIAIAIACVLIAVVLAGGAYAWRFVDALDAKLAPDAETMNELKAVLDPEVPDKPFYTLVLGSDSREGNEAEHFDEEGDNQRSDVMMLVRVDREDDVITMLSIPRDTPYKLPDGSYVKINEMYNHDGAAGAIEAVKQLTGLPVNHYAEVHISGLEGIVDYLGGVTVDVPMELTYETTDHKTVTVPAGEQTLTGQQAQIFARARHEFQQDQDAHRQDNVRQLLSAIIDKVLAKPATELPACVLEIANYVDTDFTTLDAISLARDLGDGKITMYSTSGPTNGDHNEATVGKWLCFLNPEGWSAVCAMVDAGEKPHDIDFAATETPWTEVTGQPDFGTSMARAYYYD